MSGAQLPGGGSEDSDGTVEVLAGEYVLGLLNEDASRAVEERARHEPGLAAAIASWQSRFEPLAEIPVPMAPGGALWQRIAESLDAARPVHWTPPAPVARPDTATPAHAERPGPWRGIALASLAVAACLAALIIWSKPAGDSAPPWPRAAALLSVPGSAAASLRAQVTRGGTITVVPLQHLVVPADHRLGFWAWPATERAPVLLGMLPAQGGQLPYPYAARDGTPVMVTLESASSAPGSKPGPTLYLGLLVAAGT